MPKKRTYIKYACNLCHQEYDKLEGAEECENKGWAVPEFKRNELVTVTLGEGESQIKIIGQVYSYGPKGDELIDPHMLPGDYDVNVTYGDYNPEGCPAKDSLRRHGITVWRDQLTPWSLKSDEVCPICESAVKQVVEDIYNPYILTDFDFLKKVKMSLCLNENCRFRFFNKAQLNAVNKRIARQLKGMKLADVKKLKRDREYQY